MHPSENLAELCIQEWEKKKKNLVSVWDSEVQFSCILCKDYSKLQAFQHAVKKTPQTQSKHNCFYFPLSQIEECIFQELTVDVRYSVINDFFFNMYCECLWLCY